MARVGDPAELARILRGEWAIRATTFPYWLSPNRRNPRVTIEVVEGSPLRLRETYEYHRPDKGDRELVAEMRWKGDHFAWKAIGATKLIRTACVVSDTPATPDIVSVHFGRSTMVRQPAVTLLARPHLDPDHVRAMISRDTHSFELSAGEFWRLDWLPVHPVVSSEPLPG
ncbi:hypothetical protein GCM10009846_23290 [Agrococcus versicolor]|uniref:UTRA domain-containing protein n=1 Tax=Agrococcus versicolor TaxID=501482 RepID=A0ABP5MK59_9MICO